MNLALGGAGFDLLEPVGRRVDQALVDQCLEKSLAGEPYHVLLVAVRVDGVELHDPIGDFGGGGTGGGSGGGARDYGARGEGERG